ncbi:zinc-ribbon domain-containing protein [Methanocalculus sp.]|uniref:zinc-ribbon domain-containing protein n=1 Tax=Methanocalculus sp. TaxID=2004547 RepID=UPI0026166C00|nr:zinc-ribbon domain-containing protein [Methanocalculus sp.]MDG6249434.1 zinc ribbon domain-containing protein [Methanocalculus sp.]
MELFKGKIEKIAENASGSKQCLKCGKTLERDAKFCSQCGTKSEAYVCNNCGSSIPPDAKYCPGCGTSVRPSRLGKFVGSNEEDFTRTRQWRRKPGDFASRFEVEDLRGIFKKTVTVAEGTRALLFQGGAYQGDLRPGYYDIGTFLEAHLPINLDDRATIVLVDDGIVTLDFTFDKTQIRTADSIPVGVSGTLTLRNADSKKFIDNLLKGKSQILLTDLQADLSYDIQSVVQSTLREYRMDDLYGNLSVKDEIEGGVQTRVAPILQNYGFSLERLRFVRYDESEWQDIIDGRIERTKKVTATGLDLDTEQKIRKLLSDDEISKLSDKESVDSFIHELAKAGIIRENDIEELKTELIHKREDQEFIRAIILEKAQQKHRHDIEDTELGHDLDHKDKIADHERDRDRKDLIALIEAKKKLIEAILQKKAGEQELEHKDQDHATENEGKRLKNIDNSSTESKIVITGDPKAAEYLTNIEIMRRANALSPEQILALNAKDPVTAAEALKAKFGSDKMKELFDARLEDQQKYMDMMQKTFGENADRLADVMNKALGAMGSTATARSSAHQAQGSTVVAGGGGMGQPVIINPVQPDESLICPVCKTKNDSSDQICKGCGEKLR